jgi:uncharacterized protein (DUF362 family)
MSNDNTVWTSYHVAVSVGPTTYPREPAYSPGVLYPEYPFGRDTLSQEANPAYAGVREALCALDLDKDHYGARSWNPLGEVVQPGDRVVLKPNFIREFRETQPGHENCLITHGSIIRAVLDYVYMALQGKGQIVIADAPQNDADFHVIRQITGLTEIQAFYRRHAGLDIDVYDLRPEKARKVEGVIVGHERLAGDPRGYVTVDLGRHSMFAGIEPLCHRLYGSEYDTEEIRRHHTGGVHEYLISRTVLEADCIINLPKLKTHKKTGITVCMKNLVGINGNKNWLPHHRLGTPAQGGDQFAEDGMRPRIERAIMACFREVFPRLGPLRRLLAQPLKGLGKSLFGDTNADTIRSGNWYGNDTTWRMVIDLNRILMYADANGQLQDHPARKLFCFVDGITGGEGNGPLDPQPKPAGVVVAGMNAVAVDLTCAMLMGFDPGRLPLLDQAWRHAHSLALTAFRAEDVLCRSADVRFDGRVVDLPGQGLHFQPHFGWRGHVEIRDDTGTGGEDKA